MVLPIHIRGIDGEVAAVPGLELPGEGVAEGEAHLHCAYEGSFLFHRDHTPYAVTSRPPLDPAHPAAALHGVQHGATVFIHAFPISFRAVDAEKGCGRWDMEMYLPHPEVVVEPPVHGCHMFQEGLPVPPGKELLDVRVQRDRPGQTQGLIPFRLDPLEELLVVRLERAAFAEVDQRLLGTKRDPHQGRGPEKGDEEKRRQEPPLQAHVTETHLIPPRVPPVPGNVRLSIRA